MHMIPDHCHDERSKILIETRNTGSYPIFVIMYLNMKPNLSFTFLKALGMPRK